MSSAARVITLVSSDKHQFEVEEAVAMQSKTLKHMIEDNSADSCIPLPNVDSKTLIKIIEYCKKHADSSAFVDDDGAAAADDLKSAAADDLKSFDANFVKDLDQGTLYDLIMAANYMDIKSLLDLTCKTVADMIRGKTAEEIRTLLNIKNDFTPEEEEAIRKENLWAFE